MMGHKGSNLPHFFLVATEPSGDAMGAQLITDLRRRYGEGTRFSGVGGELMAGVGLVSLFDISQTSVMGITAVLRRLPSLLRRIRETADAALAASPDAVILIDSPDFTHRVARRIKAQAPEIPIIKWVAPSVWAWRPGRAKKIAHYIDHVMAVLPFEPDIMAKLNGPPTTYVGHPLIQKLPELTSTGEERLPLSGTDRPVICLLPGSRMGEVKRLLPIFEQALNGLAERGYAFELLCPTVPTVAEYVRAQTRNWAQSPRICLGETERHAAFRQAHAALAASGTVTLELALAGVPMVVGYKLDRLAALIAPWVIRGWTASLPNLILGRPAVREYLEAFCTPQVLSHALEMLITETPERTALVESLAVVKTILTQSCQNANDIGQEAQVVQSLLAGNR